ncbi:MAG: tetratricopeptide repeat protein [Anaerotignum sp.]|nr:tetratricopeptide repeat protein [Anaerotignum sp.]MBR2851293.1 tetratricopeptide repeat protein [Anaerotignum sp.]MBR3910974.1 tetratricopeptide repeat protein [Anaerotignum sp.]MBR3992688.1 tetratricopeptide repeat protein [Anaerotignum sp.]MBR6651819.1 tetratricopeptide repeat protein [Anaerotignum sp.]
MKCPNCGFEFFEGCHCPDCGVDVYVFRKTRSASIRFYNDALKLAEERDLSGAAANLEQSLIFDKNNIPARNLLGLIYCEMGRIGDALKHWIISSSMQAEGNAAVGYIDYLQKNAREMEKCNDAIRMYNQAIHYLKQGSDDLAVIQLKKSIDNNPDFLDAYNLMTLCCIEDKNAKRAQHFNEIVLKRDIRNPLALHYAKLLGNTPASPSPLKKADKAKTPAPVSVKKTDSNPPIPRYKRREKTNSVLEKRDFMAFLAGIAAAAIVILVLIVPALNENKNNKIKELEIAVENYAGETEMTPEEVLAMRTELEKLQAENKLLRSEENKQANLELLATAVAQMSDNNFEACVTTLDSIDTVSFSEEDLAKYNSVKTTAYPKAADSYYTKGKSQFLSNNFTEAKTYLETALNYTSNENFVDDTLYYLAKIAEEDNDTVKAKELYNKIVKEYPDSNQLTNVKNALQKLNEAN